MEAFIEKQRDHRKSWLVVPAVVPDWPSRRGRGLCDVIIYEYKGQNGK